MAESLRILITGGSGFIGINLVEHYRSRGVPVLNLDAKPPRNPAHTGLWQACDILDGPGLLAQATAFQPTHLFHLAARTDLNGASLADYAANTEGTSRTIEAVTALPGLRRVIFASSRMVCRIGYQPRHDQDYCPSTPYGESKVDTERRVRAAAARAYPNG
jgi:nucleoside-diphosphate-sugar epimerase